MTHAYDEIYLNKAQTVLGAMIDYAVNGLNRNLSEFFSLFIATGKAASFESGDMNIIAGKSGRELALDVLNKANIRIDSPAAFINYERSEEFWCGWALAYYQWDMDLPFSFITGRIPVTSILSLYNPYHEMDIRQFRDKLNRMLSDTVIETNLKHHRTQIGLSQSALAKLSGVPLRTIQQYEQRQKNINKANAESIQRLSSSLCCKPSELMEVNIDWTPSGRM